MNEKLFVGGYYDDRIFEGVEEKTPFNDEINVYTLEEVLKLPFVENVIDWYEDSEDLTWEEISEKEKVKAILAYVKYDEIAGLVYFDTEEKAEEYKQSLLKEIKEIEKDYEYIGKKQDEYGNFREVYSKIKND